MRGAAFAVVGLAGVVGLAAAADPIEYKPYASADGRYKVLAAGPVKSETTEVKTPTGTVTVTLDTVKAGGVTFLVTYADAPEAVAKSPPGPRLDKVRDANKGADGKVVSEKDITVGDDKHPGREVWIDKPGGRLRARAIIAGPRLYQVTVQGPADWVGSKEADRFFDSFEVTK